jgi:hypothetical protein
MRSLKSAAIVISCFVLTLIVMTPQSVRGDEWNLATRFTVNEPFEVPGTVLQPGTPYVIRLLDSPSERHVVQIYNDSQSKLLTTFMAVSDERLEPANNTTFTFIETQPGYPLPIKEWFYPGRLHGYEFIYPKHQAQAIAEHAREPILSASASDLHHLAAISVEAVSPVTATGPAVATVTKAEPPAPLAEKPTVPEPEPQPSVAEVQPVLPPQVEAPPQIVESVPPPALVPVEPAPPVKEELPKTAGELPLIVLIGLVCLGAGLGMKVISANN